MDINTLLNNPENPRVLQVSLKARNECTRFLEILRKWGFVADEELATADRLADEFATLAEDVVIEDDVVTSFWNGEVFDLEFIHNVPQEEANAYLASLVVFMTALQHITEIRLPESKKAA